MRGNSRLSNCVMPKCGWIATILPLVAISMALGGQAPPDWTGLRRFFRQQVSDAGITVSNGGLNAPLTDMARYLRFLTGDAGHPEYDGVLRRASLEEMWAPAIRAADGEGGSGSDVHAALSFFIERHRGVELIGHSGNQNGFLSHLYVHRPSRTAYVVAFNTDVSSESRSRPRITRDVDDAVRDRLLETLAAK